MTIIFFIFLSVTIVSSERLYTHYSNEFYLGLLKNYRDDTKELWIEVTTQSNDPVPFTIRYTQNNNIVNGIVTANTSIEINLSPSRVISSFTTGHSQTAHISTLNSTQSISVIAYNWELGSVGEYIALPCHNLLLNGGEYYEYFLVSTKSLKETPPTWSQGLVIACQDNTTVTIVPSKTILLPFHLKLEFLITIYAGQSHSIVLNAGESLYIGKANSDLTGTHITASKPLTVISGHECGNVPENVNWCEHMTQQIPPTITWGKQFLLAPFSGRKHGQYYKIISSQDTTMVWYTCNGTNYKLLRFKGESVTIYGNSTTFCHVTSNKPILIVQLATGTYGDHEDSGDPIMIIVQPIEQYTTEAHFNVQSKTRFAESFVSITTTDPTLVLYDGVKLDAYWSKIYAVNNTKVIGYGTHFKVTSGSHSIVHASGKGTVMVYGFHCHPERGYGFPASVQLTPLNNRGLLTNIKFTQEEYYVIENSTFATLVITSPTFESLSVVMETVPGTAEVNSDYVSAHKVITFDDASNGTRYEIKIAIINDEWVEELEKFNIKLMTIDDSQVLDVAKIIIIDDDSLPVRFLSGLKSNSNNTNSISDRGEFTVMVGTSTAHLLQTEVKVCLNISILRNDGEMFSAVYLLYLHKNQTSIQVSFHISNITQSPIDDISSIMAVLSTDNNNNTVNVIIQQPSILIHHMTTTSSYIMPTATISLSSFVSPSILLLSSSMDTTTHTSSLVLDPISTMTSLQVDSTLMESAVDSTPSSVPIKSTVDSTLMESAVDSTPSSVPIKSTVDSTLISSLIDPIPSISSTPVIAFPPIVSTVPGMYQTTTILSPSSVETTSSVLISKQEISSVDQVVVSSQFSATFSSSILRLIPSSSSPTISLSTPISLSNGDNYFTQFNLLILVSVAIGSSLCTVFVIGIISLSVYVVKKKRSFKSKTSTSSS